MKLLLPQIGRIYSYPSTGYTTKVTGLNKSQFIRTEISNFSGPILQFPIIWKLNEYFRWLFKLGLKVS